MSDSAAALTEANAAFMAKDFQKALDLWTTALDAVDSEHHYALHTNRGAALERLGRVEDAIKAYDEALTGKPDHVEALHNRGVALKAVKRHEEALESFEAALRTSPDFYPSWRGKTDILTLLERYDDAIAAATKAMDLKPGDTGPITDRAFAHLRAKHLAAALDDYRLAQSKGDASAESKRLYAIALSQRAVELDKAGDYDAAEAHYTAAIDVEATESRLFNRAFLHMRRNRIPEAIEGYKRVVDLAPGNFQARAALGTLYLQQEKYSDAISPLSQAQELNTTAVDVIFNLGFAKMKLDDLDGAEAQFKRALEIDPSLANAKDGMEAVAAMRAGGSGGTGKLKLELGPPIIDESSGSGASSSTGAAASSSGAGGSSGGAGVARRGTTVLEAGTVASRMAAFGLTSAGSSSSSSSSSASAAGVPIIKAASSSGAGSIVGSTAAVKPAAAGSAASAGSGGDRSSSPSARYAASVDGVDGVSFPYAQLKAPGPYPDGIDLAHREAYLVDADFVKVLGCSRKDFYGYPKWKRVQIRKTHGLF